jgi:hypothetical protein
MLLTIRRDSHPKDVQIIVHLGIQPKRRRQIDAASYYQMSRHCSLCLLILERD